MTLWFNEKRDLERFLALCREHGIHGSYRIAKGYWPYRVKAQCDGKQREKITAAWAKESIIRQN